MYLNDKTIMAKTSALFTGYPVKRAFYIFFRHL